MKVVILAAGMGTRLGTLIPKPLTSITKEEKTILDYQIEALAEMVGINNIMLVVGYKKELIMEEVPDAAFAYNNAYAHNNTGKSLLTALCKLEDDVIWMNGDVFFEKEAISLLMNSPHSAMLVDTKNCAEEEIKYTLTSEGNIDKLSKEVVGGEGEAVGINMIKKADLPLFVQALEAIGTKDYFEKALENLTTSGKLTLKPIYLGEAYCKEIDFPEDLAEVCAHLEKSRQTT